jgi:hypothetical protein
VKKKTVYNITIRILSKLQRYIHSRLYFADINIYPIQFAFHSKDAYMTEGKPVHNQDLGYIRGNDNYLMKQTHAVTVFDPLC